MVCRCGLDDYNHVISAVFAECYNQPKEIASFVFGWLSIASWLLALYPQIRMNFILKRSEALSAFFLLAWITGDVFNSISCFILHQLFTQQALGIFWLCTDFVLILLHFYYQKHPGRSSPLDFGKTEVLLYVFGAGYIISNLFWAAANGYNQLLLAEAKFPLCKQAADIPHSSAQYIIGNIMAYTTIPCYCFSRPGQLYKNWKRKSTQGLSTGMFFATFSGNFCQLISMLTFSQEKEYLITKIPFILAALIPASCDLAVLLQILYYAKFYKKSP